MPENIHFSTENQLMGMAENLGSWKEILFLLFLDFIILAFMIRPDYKWNPRQFMVVLIASLIPFGTFYVDKKYLKKEVIA